MSATVVAIDSLLGVERPEHTRPFNPIHALLAALGDSVTGLTIHHVESDVRFELRP